VLFRHDAILDKFVGDEVMAIFLPALTGERHAQRALETGRDLLRATGHGEPAVWPVVRQAIRPHAALLSYRDQSLTV